MEDFSAIEWTTIRRYRDKLEIASKYFSYIVYLTTDGINTLQKYIPIPSEYHRRFFCLYKGRLSSIAWSSSQNTSNDIAAIDCIEVFGGNLGGELQLLEALSSFQLLFVEYPSYSNQYAYPHFPCMTGDSLNTYGGTQYRIVETILDYDYHKYYLLYREGKGLTWFSDDELVYLLGNQYATLVPNNVGHISQLRSLYFLGASIEIFLFKDPTYACLSVLCLWNDHIFFPSRIFLDDSYASMYPEFPFKPSKNLSSNQCYVTAPFARWLELNNIARVFPEKWGNSFSCGVCDLGEVDFENRHLRLVEFSLTDEELKRWACGETILTKIDEGLSFLRYGISIDDLVTPVSEMQFRRTVMRPYIVDDNKHVDLSDEAIMRLLADGEGDLLGY